MRTTLPFAPFALRELAEHWQRQLSEACARPQGPDAHSEAAEIAELKARLLQLLLQVISTDPDSDARRSASDRVVSMLDSGPIESALLESVAETAREDGNTVLHRRVLELLAESEDTEVRRRALERLGDLFEQLGDRRAAVDSWKPAAHMSQDTRPGRERARRLYERTLDTVPDDREAAEQLVRLYVDSNEWQRVPEVLGVVVRADADEAADLLLRLAPNALAAGARGELASMADEVLALLPPWSAQVRELRRVKARALAELPAHQAEAAEAYRALLQAFGSAADRREYEAYIGSKLEGEDRHRERRWLYQWRAANESQPAEALLAWATEEEAHGETELAITVLRRLLADAPRRKEALEALCRLLARAGDFFGAFEALEALSRASAGDERPALGQRMAGVLEGSAAAIAREASTRRDGCSLLERVERVARELGQIDPVVLSYGRALAAPDLDPVLAVTLGGHFAALEGESSVEGSFFVDALARVLALVPDARWALDRVKLTLVLEARWDEFFPLFDRAITATGRTAERAELIEEAAFAARDVAHDAERAVRYLDALWRLRPDDAAATVARRGMQRRVATLRLDRGDAGAAGAMIDAMIEGGAETADVSELLERLAAVPGQERAVERLRAHYEGLGRINDCVRLIEAVLDRAGDADPHTGLARELVRLRVAQTHGTSARPSEGPTEGRERTQTPTSEGPTEGRERTQTPMPDAFARATAIIEADVARRPALAATMLRATLRLAVGAAKRAPTDADFNDASDAAWRALDALAKLTLEAGDVKRACRLLRRGAYLSFGQTRRRELLRRAAELSADLLGDTRGAIQILEELFRQDGGDAIAVGLVDRFASLLRVAGHEDRVAILWEGQAARRAGGGSKSEARNWVLAAEAWERRGDVERAIASYDRGAALGSQESFEAMARIHGEHGRWREAAAALEWLVANASMPARARHALRLATTYVELDRSDRARECLEQVLCSGPDLEDAQAVRTQLVALYRRDATWRPLVDTLAAQARATEHRQSRAALLREAAAIARTKLDSPEEAADFLELAVASDPGDGDLRLELAGLLEGLERWGRAAGALRDRIALFGDRRSKERALLHHRLARALLRATDLVGALAELRLAAKMQPAHPAILRDLGRVALEAGDVALAEQTLRALLLALRHPVDGCLPISSAEVLLELGRIAQRKGNDARAADLADSALEAALESGEDPRCFEQALRDLGRHDRLVRTLMRHVERASDVATRAMALRDLVDVWASDLGRDAELGARLRRCARTVDLDLERERSAGGGAWAALWAVHTSLGDETWLLDRHDRLLPALREAIGRMAPGAERARLRVALARMLASQPGEVDTAITLLSSALEEGWAPEGAGEAGDLFSRYVDTVWHLGDALERSGDCTRAARLYESVLDHPSADGAPADGEMARTLAQRLEGVGSDRLADGIELQMAVDAESARGLAPRLVVLRDAQGDIAGVVRALEALVAVDPAGGAAVEDRELLRRLVGAYEALGTEQQAVTLLDRALAARPHDSELVCMRARARERTGDDAGAASDLLGLVDLEGPQLDVALSMLERITRRRAPSEADTHVIGLIDLLVRAKRTEQAQRELEALLARHPLHVGALDRLGSLAAAEGAWDRAAEIYGRLVRALEARVAAERSGAKRAVVGDAPQGPAADGAGISRAVSGLVGACERVARPADAREWLEIARRTLLESSDVALLLRAATILIERCGEPSSGLPFIERARAVHPESIEATLAWAQLEAASGRSQNVLVALQDVAQRNRGKRTPLLAAVYFMIANAHLAADDLVEALEALKAGFAIDLHCAELALLLGLVALDLGEDRTAARAFLAVAMAAARKEGTSTGATPADRVAAFYHLGGMARAEGDLAKARRWVTKAASDDPGHAGARALLAELDSITPGQRRGAEAAPRR
jgi:predicted negative regulator of RcsB-dependent stress response